MKKHLLATILVGWSAVIVSAKVKECGSLRHGTYTGIEATFDIYNQNKELQGRSSQCGESWPLIANGILYQVGWAHKAELERAAERAASKHLYQHQNDMVGLTLSEGN